MGAVLHQVIPGLINGMKPDLMLVMMFLGILLFPNKKYVLLVAVVAGLISALTTQVPGGQIPNIIDKLVTAFSFFGLIVLSKKFFERKPVIIASVLTAIGIIISGTVFLTATLFIAGLPQAFLTLFVGIVLPTAALSTVVMFFIYPVVQQILKRTNLTIQA